MDKEAPLAESSACYYRWLLGGVDLQTKKIECLSERRRRYGWVREIEERANDEDE